MTKVTRKGLEQKWWFVGGVAALSALLTLAMLDAAGIVSPDNWAQWMVHFLCFSAIWKCVSFIGWLVVLMTAPSSKLLDPAKR